MSVLKNQRHEAFAQLLAKGMSASEAYRTAGYKPDRGASSRMSAKVSIRQRVEELLGKAAEKTLVTIESVTLELEEARKHAMQDPKGASAAVAACMGKAKLHGLVVDKAELAGKDGGPIEVAKIERIVVDSPHAADRDTAGIPTTH